jgi:hypothetical protein
MPHKVEKLDICNSNMELFCCSDRFIPMHLDVTLKIAGYGRALKLGIGVTY